MLLSEASFARFFYLNIIFNSNDCQASFYINVPRWYRCFTRCGPLYERITQNFHIFLKRAWYFSEANINMAVKTLLILSLEMIHLIKKKVIGVRNASYKKGNWNNYITRFLDISVSKQNDETAYHFEVWSNKYGILF